MAQCLKKIGKPLASDQALLTMRSESTLTCPTPPADAKPCHIMNSVCLFNVTADPCERNNVLFKYPDVVKLMDQTLAMYAKSAVPRLNKPKEARADPKYFDYSWTNWLDYYEPLEEQEVPEHDVDSSSRLLINDATIQQMIEPISTDFGLL